MHDTSGTVLTSAVLLQTLKTATKDAGVKPSQLDWLVLHQANQQTLGAAAQC